MAVAISPSITKQTEAIIKNLCAEIKHHNDAFNRTERAGSFAKSLLRRRKMDRELQRNQESLNLSDKDLEFKMDDLEPHADNSIDYIESNLDSETSADDISEYLNDTSLSDDEAIEAIIAAINRMAMKIDQDPKIATLLQKTSAEERSSVNFNRFNSLILRLLDDISPGLSVDSWGNAMFLLIIALKVSELKQYPQEFFKRYVYDKIVPWVTRQPDGWISAKYDEKVGVAVKSASVAVKGTSSTTDSLDLSHSPSSLLSWFSFPRRMSSGSAEP